MYSFATINNGRLETMYRKNGKPTSAMYDRFGFELDGKKMYPIFDYRSALAATTLMIQNTLTKDHWWKLTDEQRIQFTLNVYTHVVKIPMSGEQDMPQYNYVSGKLKLVPPSWDMSSTLNVARPKYNTPNKPELHFGNPFVPYSTPAHRKAVEYGGGIGIYVQDQHQPGKDACDHDAAAEVCCQLYEYWLLEPEDHDGEYLNHEAKPIDLRTIEPERREWILSIIPWIREYITVMMCHCYDETICHSRVLRKMTQMPQFQHAPTVHMSEMDLDRLNGSFWGQESALRKDTKDGFCSNFKWFDKPVPDSQIPDVYYNTPEHLYQALKVKVLNADGTLNEYGVQWRRYIAESSAPNIAKQRAREFISRCKTEAQAENLRVKGWVKDDNPKEALAYKCMEKVAEIKYPLGGLWTIQLITSGYRQLSEWNRHNDQRWGIYWKTGTGLDWLGHITTDRRHNVYMKCEALLSA